LTVDSEGLHEISGDSGIRVVNFTMAKESKGSMFPHHNIHKYTWTSPDGQTHNQTEYVFTDSRQCSGIIDVHSYRGADWDTDHYLVVAKVSSEKTKQRGS